MGQNILIDIRENRTIIIKIIDETEQDFGTYN